jgi:hypothetical protein
MSASSARSAVAFPSYNKKGDSLSTAAPFYFWPSKLGPYVDETSNLAIRQSNYPTTRLPNYQIHSPRSPVRGASASSGSTKYSISRSSSSSSSLGCGGAGGGGGSSAGIRTCR